MTNCELWASLEQNTFFVAIFRHIQRNFEHKYVIDILYYNGYRILTIANKVDSSSVGFIDRKSIRIWPSMDDPTIIIMCCVNNAKSAFAKETLVSIYNPTTHTKEIYHNIDLYNPTAIQEIEDLIKFNMQ